MKTIVQKKDRLIKKIVLYKYATLSNLVLHAGYRVVGELKLLDIFFKITKS